MNQRLSVLLQNYDIIQNMFQNNYSQIFKGQEIQTGIEVILKCTNKKLLLNNEINEQKQKLKQELLDNQIESINICQGQNIVECIDLQENEQWRVLVLEECNQGNLRNKIIKKGKFQESQTLEIMCQIMAGAAIFIKNKMMFPILKTENIMIHNGVYKILIDYQYRQNQSQISQYLEEKHFYKNSIWQFGQIIYQILTGDAPFKQNINKQQIEKFHKNIVLTNIPHEFKDLFKNIFVQEPEKQINWNYLFKIYKTKIGVFLKINPRMIKKKQKCRRNILFMSSLVEIKSSLNCDFKNDNKFNNFLKNVVIINQIYNSTLKILNVKISYFKNQMDNNIFQLLLYYYLMINNQIMKIIQQNHNYLHLQNLQDIEELMDGNETIILFNKFARLIFENKQKYLFKFSQTIQGFKGLKIRVISFFNKNSTNLTHQDIIDLQNKYAFCSCDQSQLFNKTNQIFKKLWLKVCEIQRIVSLFAPINKFMKQRYQILLNQRIKRI